MAEILAPYESCISCYMGDVTTAVAFRGEAEFIVAGLGQILSPEDASATFAVFAEQELGCDPGKVPAGEVTQFVRLCTECASTLGLKVGPLPDNVPCYLQPAREEG